MALTPQVADNRTCADDQDATRLLLSAATFQRWPDEPGDTDAGAKILRVRHQLSVRRPTAESLATSIGELFAALAELSGNQHAVTLICASNERLHDTRVRECRYLANVSAELAALCDLTLAGRRAELRRALIAYHERRCEAQPGLQNVLIRERK